MSTNAGGERSPRISKYEVQARPNASTLEKRVRRAANDELAALAALRESEARYRLLAEMSTDMISRHDLNGVFLYVSPACLPLLGYVPEELVGRSAYTLIHPGDRDVVTAAHSAVSEKPDTVTVTFRLCSKDGRYIWFESINRSIADEQTGVIYEIQVASRNITKRKHAEDAQRFMADISRVLADSLDYETTLSNAAQLAVPILADRCIIHLLCEDGSQAVVVAHSDPEQEAMLRVQAEQQAIALNSNHVVAQVLRTGEPLTQRQGDPGAPTQNAMVVPLIARERTIGTITFAAMMDRRYGAQDLVLAQAVAQRAALAVDNARLYAGAQQALALRDQFLLVAAHELKTPVTTLSGHVQMAQRRLNQTYDLLERDQQALQIMHYQADRLTRLIDALLDISRLQEGKLALECVPVDLGRIARRIVTDVQLTLDKHTLRLKVPRKPLMVNGDALRLEQAINNLIQNAVKYSPEGGTILVHIVRQAGEACIVITDHGIGIPEEALPKLFDRFYRAPNATYQAIGGIGIGLYVVHEIIALHGGSIEVTSKIEQGTSFRVSLPLLQDVPTATVA